MTNLAHTTFRAFAAAISFLNVGAFAAPGAIAHPGGLDKDGCHNNRKTSEYHCHKANGTTEKRKKPASRND